MEAEMTVTVKFFASLREQVGRSEDTIDIEGETSVADIWRRATAASQQALPDTVLAAVNMEYAKPDSRVRDGDEVAFFPPVTGG